jgi:two-component system chemotaxis response regulator CheB
MKTEGPLRTLIVDDSPLYRRVLATELGRTGEVHASACDGTVESVRNCLLQHHPAVIVIDLKLRTGDALMLLRRLRANYPVPVIACTDAVGEPRDRAVKAVELGAAEVMRKPPNIRPAALGAYARELTHKLRSVLVLAGRPVGARRAGPAEEHTFRAAGLDPSRYLVVIGASTGGTEALTSVFRSVCSDFPPTVIVQHMPAGFTRSFAERLNGLSPMQVAEARDGEPLRAGGALLARGDTHLVVRAAGPDWVVRYTHQQPVNRHCPSVDVLFESAAAFGKRAVGVLLTGMGADGARGLLRLREAGALTIGQNEASCVVYGMPKVAVDLGAVTYTAAPDEIPELILRTLSERRKQAATPA